jgi:hypothetical protein
MARTYFCASCGWKCRTERDPEECPDCGNFTQRYHTTWDSVVSDLRKVVAFCAVFITIASIGTWLMYPYQFDGANDFTARFRLDSVSLMDSPTGSVARLSLRNDSRWEMDRVELTVQIHAIAPGDQTGMIAVTGPKQMVLEKLGPDSEQFLDVPVEGRKAGELFGWTAKIESVRLAPGYWNKRLESALSPRLIGQNQNDLVPFPRNFPNRHIGK